MAPRTTNFIISFNLVTLLLGIIMMAIGIDVKQQFVSGGWGGLVSVNSVWALIFGGLFMIMISFLGCYSARKNKKFLLAIYLCCVAVLMAILIGGTVSMVGYQSYFSHPVPSYQITSQGAADVNNMVLSAYIKCCSGCSSTGSGPATLTQMCTNPPIGNDYVSAVRAQNGPNGLAGWCSTAPSGTCVVPTLCSLTPTASYCFQYLSTYTGFQMVPSQLTDTGVCTLLRTTSINGHSIVDYPSTGGCGAGTPAGFYQDIDNYFSPKIYFAGVLFIFIACVQGTILLVGCYIIFFVSKKDIIDDGMDTVNFRRGKDERDARF